MGLRRSFALASADRYFAVTLNFATLLVTARLLTPEQIGISVLGLSILGLAETIHDFGGSSYIVQSKSLSPERVQAVFTFTFFLTLFLALLLLLFAGSIASFYGEAGLESFIYVTTLSLLLGPFVSPVYALLRRGFEFGKLAILNSISAAVNSSVTILLVLLDFGYISFAWGCLASGAVFLALCNWWSPPTKVYRLSVSGWREIAEYGVYDSLRRLLYFAWDSLPLLAFGKTLGAGGLGLYQRALTIAKLPEKTVLTGLAPVLLPAYAQQAREGGNLTTALLRSIEYVTAIFWPAMILIAILAKPIVDVLLGSQWIAAVPIIQLIAVALLLQLPASIANSIQIAAGGVRDSFILALIIVPITIVIQVYASTYGLTAAAASLFITCPLGLIASLVVLRWRIPFTRQELLGAVRSSAIVAFFTALAPAIIAILSGGTQKISIMGAAIALVLAGIGWLVGLRIARHPLLDEIGRVRDALVTRLSGRA